MVIQKKKEYTQKVLDFKRNNNLKKLDRDPTKAYVKELNNAINQCRVLLDEKTRTYLKPINAKAPKFTGLPKLQKENTPIRPVINYTTASGYKAAKLLETIIKNNIRIKNNYSI